MPYVGWLSYIRSNLLINASENGFILSIPLISLGSEFQKVGPLTMMALAPTDVLHLGMYRWLFVLRLVNLAAFT